MSAEGQVGSGGVTQSMFKWIGSEIIKCIQRKRIRGMNDSPRDWYLKRSGPLRSIILFNQSSSGTPLFFWKYKRRNGSKEAFIVSANCSSLVFMHCTSVYLFPNMTKPVAVKQVTKGDRLLQWNSSLRLHLKLLQPHTCRHTHTGLTV